MSNIVTGSVIEVTTESAIDVITTESAIDVVTSGGVIDVPLEPTISLDGVENGLHAIIEELQSSHTALIEKIDNFALTESDRFEAVEEWKDYFFDIFENFGNVSFEFLSIIGGILIALFLWFVIKLVYKFFRMFI